MDGRHFDLFDDSFWPAKRRTTAEAIGTKNKETSLILISLSFD